MNWKNSVKICHDNNNDMSLNGYNPFYKNIANENNVVYDYASITDLFVDSISAQYASFGYIEMQEY